MLTLGEGAKDLEDKMAAATLSGGIGVAPRGAEGGQRLPHQLDEHERCGHRQDSLGAVEGLGRHVRPRDSARVPRRLLDCSAVSREVNFTSEFKMKDFGSEQRVLLPR